MGDSVHGLDFPKSPTGGESVKSSGLTITDDLDEEKDEDGELTPTRRSLRNGSTGSFKGASSFLDKAKQIFSSSKDANSLVVLNLQEVTIFFTSFAPCCVFAPYI